ncbi:MAG: 2-C-methyl-D-erythritol 4-phosphate cytidylyltransferase [Treponema sp.]|jgi:2-C-methyl-D-erythritol 4-phosphate cytidylyltransferase|nr:2-C-methyl-D-erythritol 4-phosphate cytidylyltransferase [Treponema sp.]
MGTSIAAVITAADSSTRMGGKKKKPCSSGNFRSVGAAVGVFASIGRIGPIIITVPPNADNGEYAARRALRRRQDISAIFFAPGIASRRISVHQALSTLTGFKPDYVLIHDGAHLWIRPALVDRFPYDILF